MTLYVQQINYYTENPVKMTPYKSSKALPIEPYQSDHRSESAGA